MLKLFQYDVYAFHDPGAAVSIVTFMYIGYLICHDILLVPFYASTPVGNSMVA